MSHPSVHGLMLSLYIYNPTVSEQEPENIQITFIKYTVKIVAFYYELLLIIYHCA